MPEKDDAEKTAHKAEEEMINSIDEQIVVEKNLNNDKLLGMIKTIFIFMYSLN